MSYIVLTATVDEQFSHENINLSDDSERALRALIKASTAVPNGFKSSLSNFNDLFFRMAAASSGSSHLWSAKFAIRCVHSHVALASPSPCGRPQLANVTLQTQEYTTPSASKKKKRGAYLLPVWGRCDNSTDQGR